MVTGTRDKALELKKEGLSYAAIGRELGISRQGARELILGRLPHKKPDLDHAIMLTIGEASKLLGVHVNTLRRWEKEGVIRSYRIGLRHDRRYRIEDIRKILRETAEAG